MTSAEFRAARLALGLTQEGMARALELASTRTIQGWEAGRFPIPGPARVAIRLMLRTPKRKRDNAERDG